MHKENCFITLTFDNEHLPEDYSVHVRTWQLFMKKLRKKFGSKIRFYACGEYGDLNKRPHYHALIFNHDFHDKKYYQTTPQENILYTSQTLTDLWSYGFATTGNIDYQSAGYCTRYNMKKINGGIAADHYWREHPLTKQMVSVQPEFATQSRRPGLGQKFFEQHKAEIFPADYIVIEGRKLPVPRYYLNQLTEEERTKILKRRNPVGVEVDAASGRVLLVDKTESRANKTSERLRSREAVQKARISSLKRNI